MFMMLLKRVTNFLYVHSKRGMTRDLTLLCSCYVVAVSLIGVYASKNRIRSPAVRLRYRHEFFRSRFPSNETVVMVTRMDTPKSGIRWKTGTSLIRNKS